MSNTDFLRGGGEMGKTVRAFNWSDHIFGTPEKWPLSLQTTVGIVLHSAFPNLLLWGPELICFYNDAFRPSLGVTGKHPAIGKKCEEIWPEIWDFIGPLMRNVMTNGEPVLFEDQLVPFYRNGKIEDIFWTFCYSPAYNDKGEIGGVFVVCHETTAKIAALATIKDQKDQLKFAIDAAELGTWDLNPVTNKFKANDRLKEWFGLRPEEEIDLSLATEVISERDRPKVVSAITKALQFDSGGQYDVEYTIVNPHSGKETIVKAKGKASFDDQHHPTAFSGTLQDVTLEATARKQFEEAELFSRTIFHNSPVANIVFTGDNLTVERVNANMLEMLGRDETILGKPFFEVMPELLNTPLIDRMRRVMKTGETYFQPEEKLVILHKGNPHEGYYNYAYKPLVSADKEIYGIMCTATEVTDQVISRQLVEGKEKELRDLISASPIGICVLKGNPVYAEEFNDRFLEISGRTRQQFETTPYWEVMHEVAHLFEQTLEAVFETGIRYTSEEQEMVLVRSGSPEKIFATFEYIPVTNAENIVVKVIVMVMEVTYQVETRRQIEEAVVNRTKELAESNLKLKRSNEELEQFAYIASHDLQEPIRKISTFTQMLEGSVEGISESSRGYITKIYNSANRMRNLVRDVLAFSRISNEDFDFEAVELKNILNTVRSDFDMPINESAAEIHIGNLPKIEAIPSQMIQLFGNLMSNSLKYRRPGIPPVITITSSLAGEKEVAKWMALDSSKKYIHIRFIDNGIGFSRDHVERIFRIFQRLHSKSQFEGTGIGLSICLKIVQNHGGHITADVNESGGAIFNILLPEVQNKR